MEIDFTPMSNYKLWTDEEVKRLIDVVSMNK